MALPSGTGKRAALEPRSSRPSLAADFPDRLPAKAWIGITGGTSTPEFELEAVRDRVYALAAP